MYLSFRFLVLHGLLALENQGAGRKSYMLFWGTCLGCQPSNAPVNASSRGLVERPRRPYSRACRNIDVSLLQAEPGKLDGCSLLRVRGAVCRVMAPRFKERGPMVGQMLSPHEVRVRSLE
jgi:hypothetical protein